MHPVQSALVFAGLGAAVVFLVCCYLYLSGGRERLAQVMLDAIPNQACYVAGVV